MSGPENVSWLFMEQVYGGIAWSSYFYEAVYTLISQTDDWHFDRHFSMDFVRSISIHLTMWLCWSLPLHHT